MVRDMHPIQLTHMLGFIWDQHISSDSITREIQLFLTLQRKMSLSYTDLERISAVSIEMVTGEQQRFECVC